MEKNAWKSLSQKSMKFSLISNKKVKEAWKKRTNIWMKTSKLLLPILPKANCQLWRKMR